MNATTGTERNARPPRALLLVLAVVLWAPDLSGQRAILRFEHLTVEDGISDNYINGIVRDAQGLMWFATGYGISKFDGYRFTVYCHVDGDPSSLPQDYVRGILSDRRGRLWAGTEDGLALYDHATDRFTRFLPGKRIRHIAEDRAGKLWLSAGTELLEFDPATSRVRSYSHRDDEPSSLAPSRITAACVTRDGQVWVATNLAGLDRFDPASQRFHHYRADPRNPHSLSSDVVLSFLEDSRGRLWIGTKNGLCRYRPETDDFQVYSQPEFPISGEVIMAMAEDASGTLWIGSYGGLNRFDPQQERFTVHRRDPGDPHSLADNQIRSLFCHESLVWIGTQVGGVDRLDRLTLPFETYRHDPRDPGSLAGNDIRAILEDSEGQLWIGTFGEGLDCLSRDRLTMRHYRHDPNRASSLSHDQVLALLEDADGKLWVGTNDGLNVVDRRTGVFTRYRHRPDDPTSLGFDAILSLYEDRKGQLWIGTFGGGLDRLDRKTGVFTHFKHDPADPSSISNDNVRCIFEDRRGQLWVGTVEGLNLFDPATRRFTLFHDPVADPKGPSRHAVESIREDAAGRLWVGISGEGPVLIDGERRRLTRFNQGLEFLLSLHSMLIDDRGELWLGMSLGLCRFDPDRRSAVVYQARDGLQDTQFPYLNACAKSRDGRLYFGGANGLTAFRPEEIQANTIPPPVILTDLRIFNRPVPIANPTALQAGAGKPARFELAQHISRTRTITLTHENSSFSLEFSALDYRRPDKNRFAHRLEGFDPDWVTTDYKERKATYTNLPKGDYVFRVKASNDEGAWTEGASLSIHVLPPWWLTWWMKAIYALLFVTIGPSFYFWRVNALEKRQRELEDQVASRTAELRAANEELVALDGFKQALMGMIVHDLKNPLSLILSIVESHSLASQVALLRHSARQMLTMVLNILDVQKFEDTRMTLDSRDCGLRELADGAVTQVRFLLDRKNITILTRIAPDLGARVDAEMVERVLVNLLTNAIKYTPNNGRIELTGQGDDAGVVRVEVRDEGDGIPPDKLEHVFDKFAQVRATRSGGVRSTGLGLTFCKLAVEAHGGAVGVRSEVGKGSTFWLTLPAAISAVRSEPGHDGGSVALRPPTPHGHAAGGARPADAPPAVLTDADRALLAPFLPALRSLQIYHYSDLRRTLKRPDFPSNERVDLWKKRLEAAIEAENQPLFEALLNP